MNQVQSRFAGFLPYALRLLAVICVAVGSITFIALLAQIGTTGFRYPWQRFFSMFERVRRGTEIVNVALALTLAVGGAGLLRWRRWSRTVLITWSICSMVSIVVSNIAWFSELASSRAHASTTMPAYGPSLGYLVWLFVGALPQSCAFQIVVVCLLMHSEVEMQWGHRSKGFEVVPFAQTATENLGAR